MNIEEIAKEYTREEFLEEAQQPCMGKLKDKKSCPESYNLISFSTEDKCIPFKNCKDCWKEAIKDIKFKGEETIAATCIKSEHNKKSGQLTKDKEYLVKQSQYTNFYELVNDLGKIDTYRKERFKIVEGEKMEKKIIVKCINTGIYEDITKDEEYKVIDEEKSQYYIRNDYEVAKTYPKELFKKVEDILMVECIDNGKGSMCITIGKHYPVIKENENTYTITSDNEEENKYYKCRFKQVELQKEVKEPINYEEEYNKLKKDHNIAFQYNKDLSEAQNNMILELDKELKEVYSANKRLAKRTEELEKEKLEYLLRLNNQGKRISTDGKQIQKLLEENKELKSEIKQHEKDKKIVCDENFNLTIENKKYQGYQGYKEIIERLNKRIEELEKLNEQSYIDIIEAEKREKEAMNPRLKCQFEEAQQRIKILEKEKESHIKQIKDLVSKHNEEQGEKLIRQKENIDLRNALKTLASLV